MVDADSVRNETSSPEENDHVKDVDITLGRNQTTTEKGVKCKEGYRVVEGRCVDIDECAEKPEPCEGEEDGSVCHNYEGSYYCRKPDDHADLVNDSKNSTNVDRGMGEGDEEDEEEEASAEESESCLTGYVWNEELKECEDEDECETGNFYCFTGEVCENTDGSYVCEKVECEDDEKLDEETGVCVPKDQCEDGYRFNPIRDECENIDECLEAADGKNLCDSGSVCEDTKGSFKCIKSDCEPGFEMKKSWFGAPSCQDIDECTLGNHNCSDNEVCVNTDGSFDCDCNMGFRKNSENNCEDIDECTDSGVEGVNACSSMTSFCVNTPGSFNCTCKEGFKETSRNTCDDIKECDENDACEENQICVEKFGSFNCLCKTGFVTGPGGKCIPQNKPCHGIIKDKFCSCPNGFKLNSTDSYDACEDVNECEQEAQCNEDEHCVNTYGNYKCADISCPRGYVRDKDSR